MKHNTIKFYLFQSLLLFEIKIILNEFYLQMIKKINTK